MIPISCRPDIVCVDLLNLCIFFIFHIFFCMYLKSALVSKGSEMLETEVESGKKDFFFLYPSAKQEAAAHWNSSSYLLKCLQRILKAGHEYVDMQKMTKADVTLISTGPFYIIVANIQHLFWLPTFFCPCLSTSFYFYPLGPVPYIYIFLCVPRRSLLLIFLFYRAG